jgi:hypothetical protein
MWFTFSLSSIMFVHRARVIKQYGLRASFREATACVFCFLNWKKWLEVEIVLMSYHYHEDFFNTLEIIWLLGSTGEVRTSWPLWEIKPWIDEWINSDYEIRKREWFCYWSNPIIILHCLALYDCFFHHFSYLLHSWMHLVVLPSWGLPFNDTSTASCILSEVYVNCQVLYCFHWFLIKMSEKFYQLDLSCLHFLVHLGFYLLVVWPLELIMINNYVILIVCVLHVFLVCYKISS